MTRATPLCRPHTLRSLFYMDTVTPSPSGATMADAAATDAGSDHDDSAQSDRHHRRQHSRPPEMADMLSPLEQPPQPATHGHAAVIPDFHPCALPPGGLLDGRMTDLGCQSRGETPSLSHTMLPSHPRNRVHDSVLLDLASSPRSATRPLTHQKSFGKRNLTTSTRAFHVIVLCTRNKLFMSTKAPFALSSSSTTRRETMRTM